MVSINIPSDDIPIAKLKPLSDRKIAKREYERIKSSIRAVGLIEPLIVSADGNSYAILDGVQRYRALLELKVEIVPCIIREEKETFTCNRMVNHISPVQEIRMIEKSLEELDEATIANALGLSTITHRLSRTLMNQLHTDIAHAFDNGNITRTCAAEFTYVKPERQQEIMAVMKAHNDYSIAFARALIIKTPPMQRTQKRRHATNPWDRIVHKKNDLLKKLQDAEQKHDFYSRLYRQYAVDLLKLVIYARNLITNLRVRTYLDQYHSTIVSLFQDIVAQTEASK